MISDKDKALICYRTLVDDLQGKTIYVEDEGILKRWTPPTRPIFDGKIIDTKRGDFNE